VSRESVKKIFILYFVLSFAVNVLYPNPPACAENWYENGVSLLNSGKYEEAVKSFSLAIETLPHDYESFNKRGVAYIGTGDISRAVSDFTKAIEINPLFADALSNKCAALCDMGDYDRAIEDCTRAIGINQRSSKAYNNRGISWNNKGSVENAIADYIKAIEINPGYADAYNNLAWIYATCPEKNFRNGEKALAYAQKAVQFSSDPYYLDTLAAAFAENNRFGEAVEIQEKVIAASAESHREQYEEHLELYEARKPLRDTLLVIQHKNKIKEVNPPPSAIPVNITVPKIPERIYALSCDGNCPYSVQAGSFRDYGKSYDETMKIKTKVETAYNSYASVKKDGGGWYRVLIGAFKTLNEAQKAASGLKEIGIHDALAVKTPYVIIIPDTPYGEVLQRLESDKFIYYLVKNREKIFIGAFETEKDAKYFSSRLKEKGYKITIGER